MKELRLERHGTVAVLFFDQPHRPVNLLSEQALAELQQSLQEIAADDTYHAVVLASARPGMFLAGADVSSFLGFADEAAVVDKIRDGNALLDAIEQYQKPIVAAVDGPCLGGGTELILACHYVIASTSSRTRFSLPEVQLGLLPGLGGTVRFTERLGVSTALPYMLTGRPLFPRQARSLGLVDATTHQEGLLHAAVQAATELARGDRTKRERKPALVKRALDSKLGAHFVFQQAERETRAKTRGNFPAPLKILEVVKAYVEGGHAAGFAAAASGFAQLLFTPEAKALLHLFFAQTAAKRGGEKDLVQDVQTVGMIGAGLMGSGIAEVSVEHGGYDVLLKDIDLAAAYRGRGAVAKSLGKKVGKQLTAFDRDRLVEQVQPVDNFAAFTAADIVIEAVLENVELKQETLAAIEALPGERIFATNTSAIPLREITANAQHPERVVGMHYFSPVPKMPLLEIVTSDKTSPEVLATAREVGKRQGKTMIVVQDGPGFYTTRMIGVYVAEALLAIRSGVAPLALDQALVDLGFPLGPFAMLDDVGIATGASIQRVLQELLESRGYTPDTAADTLVAAGYTGRASGKGFYRYENGKRKREIDPQVHRLLGLPTEATKSAAEAARRILLLLINEAYRCLDDGTLQSADDGDIGAVFGFGFPPQLGGPFHYARSMQKEALIHELEALAAQFGARFEPAGGIKEE